VNDREDMDHEGTGARFLWAVWIGVPLVICAALSVICYWITGRTGF
jgi:hypothetical protein